MNADTIVTEMQLELQHLRTENALLKLREVIQDAIGDLDEVLYSGTSTELLDETRDRLQEALGVQR